ncbi:porin [Corynebacterium yudongzhengii]|uniref:Porin n=1 Tax=Corynebacterium yudongzhengii TaxID=2080740 RepID=A0A2U1T666_9CORY|nr:porin [Corynebacterium yudongzhengii]AWB82656.1 porin [Corynebacterium yudongzhengii]PWC01378.1 porin [Corynebacterium yudongzhengii]
MSDNSSFSEFATNLNALSSEGFFGWLFDTWGELTDIAAGASDLIGLVL